MNEKIEEFNDSIEESNLGRKTCDLINQNPEWQQCTEEQGIHYLTLTTLQTARLLGKKYAECNSVLPSLGTPAQPATSTQHAPPARPAAPTRPSTPAPASTAKPQAKQSSASATPAAASQPAKQTLSSAQSKALAMQVLEDIRLKPPKSVHYERFNDNNDFMKKRDVMRAAITNLLDGILMREGNDPTKPGQIVGWKLGMPIESLPDDLPIKLGQHFQLTGKELKELLASTTVSHDPYMGLSAAKLAEILTGGSKTENDHILARYRMVGSDVVFTHTPRRPIPRKIGEPLPKCRIYTGNAVNLSDDPNANVPKADKQRFLKIDKTGKPELNEKEYTEEAKGILHHFFMNCKADE